MKRDSGQITTFVVVIFAALVLVAGLVFDGGLILSARLLVLNQAQEAARAGAQAIDLGAYRATGTITLDPSQAAAAAHAYLASIGADGNVRVTGDRVSVTVRRTQGTQILAIAGIASVSVHGTAIAHPVRGITGVIP